MIPARTNGSATTPRVLESHAFFGTRFVRQKLKRLLGITPRVVLTAETAVGVLQIPKVLWEE